MIDLLGLLVEAESPSLDPASQDAVLRHLASFLSDIAYGTWRLPGQGRSGGQLYARPARRVRGRPVQLLLGHCDTVWPLGTLETMPFVVEGNEARGPGVYDMKGGLVQMLYALKTLRELGLDPPVTPVVLVNSDEEIGSRESRPMIDRMARRAVRAFVFEPALDLDGKLKTARKGGGLFEITVHGRSSHAGLAPEAGASAIVELAHVIQNLHALNDYEAGISVNVGQIDGGIRPNVVAGASKARVDVRVPTAEAARRIETAIRSLEPATEGTRIEVAGGFGRPPMERTARNAALWEAAREAGARLGLALDEGRAGGGSDGSFTSAYTATLDGLGAVGDGAHAAHEFMYLDQMIERSALTALLLLLPPQRERSARAADPAAEAGPVPVDAPTEGGAA